MTVERILICVLIMALVTYLTRMLPLAIFKKKITNRFIRSFLAYVPYAVLSAMTFPAILYSTAEPGSAATAANMIAAGLGLAVALLLAYLLVLPWAGYLAATIPFLFCSMLFLGPRAPKNIVTYAVLSTGMSLLLKFIFGNLLKFFLP